ncbi:MAG: MMPL family transporter [Deltaproteobacteria bacterium]|nr:MMPL family transporter [Deltaproteobacteria bacterium]
MNIGAKLVDWAIRRPRLVTVSMIIATIVLGSLIALVKVDTDPENMLSAKETVRIFHNQVKKDFDLNDVVVLGIVNEKDKDGVFNPQTLAKVTELTTFIRTLSWPDPAHPGQQIGVIKRNLIAPGTVDSIEQGGPGEVRFAWLMQEAPPTREEAARIRRLAQANPLLNGTLISEDGRALAIYIPISSKDLAYRVKKELEKKIATFTGDEAYHITGLPVAEDTFGVEMFIQMAISAPVAMLLIFLLMLFFFRQIKLILAPMIIAMVSVICTMGLLIGCGNTLHIMSSMIPIFLMPIAVVDSIHILSEFFDQYQKTRDRQKTIKEVMSKLFAPMLYTSLTTAAGFLSLTLTPIPPVQIFGLFVALGIVIAWVLTMTFVPAYVMLLKESSLAGFGQTHGGESGTSPTHRFLAWLSRFTVVRAKLIVGSCLILLLIAGYGISKIQINDNPVKWFTKSHPIRVADHILNHHFGGTYEAYLVIEPAQGETKEFSPTLLGEKLRHAIEPRLTALANGPELRSASNQILDELEKEQLGNREEFLRALRERFQALQEKTTDDNLFEAWYPLIETVESAMEETAVFKNPQVLHYIESLQNELKKHPQVGKSNSIVDVVKKVHQELLSGNPEDFSIPDSRAAVAQCLISFQNSHKPEDLWHLVTPDFRRANLWVQLHSGDNQDMEAVIDTVKRFTALNQPPLPLTFRWAGLTYINVVWQDKMVAGMLKSLLGSFVIVLIMMVMLFRSPLWGLIAMIPLTVTITLIYGIIGLIGKDYDMPVAVLSSLTLGLAVDFAIHFLERSRMAFRECGSWKAASRIMFEEPARAISRNIIVIAVGFTPLLLAPLMPYKTVGIFLASIMLISGLATIMILPALLTLGQNYLFRKINPTQKEKP